MILMTARIVKVLLLLAALMGSYFLLREKINKWQLGCIAVLLIALSIAANAISEQVPPLTDSVTLTALGEKSENSQGYEIVIDGFEIDGI